MRIGDLPRARRRSKTRSDTVFQALLAVLAVGFVLTGWLNLSSSQAERRAGRDDVTTAAPRQGGESRSQAASVPKPMPLPQVADAGSVSSFSGVMPAALPPEPASEVPDQGSLAEAGGPSDPVAPAVSYEPAQEAPETTQASAAPPPATPAPAPEEVTGAVNAMVGSTAETDEPKDLVDLNSGSFQDLNTLRGGGPIGRAIIRGRPYVSAEELVTKKILRRPVYERIKNQVTVR